MTWKRRVHEWFTNYLLNSRVATATVKKKKKIRLILHRSESFFVGNLSLRTDQNQIPTQTKPSRFPTYQQWPAHGAKYVRRFSFVLRAGLFGSFADFWLTFVHGHLKKREDSPDSRSAVYDKNEITNAVEHTRRFDLQNVFGDEKCQNIQVETNVTNVQRDRRRDNPH